MNESISGKTINEIFDALRDLGDVYWLNLPGMEINNAHNKGYVEGVDAATKLLVEILRKNGFEIKKRTGAKNA